MTTTVRGSIHRAVGNPAPVDDTASPEANPLRVGLGVVAVSYLILTATLLVVGWCLTHPLNNSVGRWDEHVNEYLARRRTGDWNGITGVATASFNTLPVVLAASAVAGFLAWRRRWREAAFLTVALLIEITVFLSVTFIVARPRPDVVRLNSTPATSSFPSGHTAAATVLFVGIALIVTWNTRNIWARAAASILAILTVTNVAFARVYRGLHHPTDVVAGALFGVACVVAAAWVVRAAFRRRDHLEYNVDDAGDVRMTA